MGGTLFAHRLRLASALRVGSHVTLGLLDPRVRARDLPRRVVLTASALSLDFAHSRWLARDPYRRLDATRTAVDTAEAVVWTQIAGPCPQRTRAVQIAHVVPAAAEAGLRLGAGDRALPLVEPRHPYPPAPGTTLRRAVETLAPIAIPLVAQGITRRRRGWGWDPPSELPLAPAALSVAFFLARYRDHLQHRARQEWWARATAQVQAERSLARASWATRPTPGHDFKKNLVVLGLAGSEPARRAAHDQTAYPHRVATATDGTTIFGAALGIPIEPAGARDIWISTAQRVTLDAHLARVDELLEDRAPHPLLEVLDLDEQRIHLRYRGFGLVLSNPPPRFEGALDPTAAALALSAMWKILGARWKQSPTMAAIGLVTAGGDAALLIRHHRHRSDSYDRRFMVSATAALAINIAHQVGVLVTGGPADDPKGNPVVTATGAALGMFGVLGTCRDQLGPGPAWALTAATLAAWAIGDSRNQRAWTTTAIELNSMWQCYSASRGLATRMATEAQAVEGGLRREFEQQVRQARDLAQQAEMARFRAQVELAEVELPKVWDQLDPDLARYVAAQCNEVHKWLESPGTAERESSSSKTSWPTPARS